MLAKRAERIAALLCLLIPACGPLMDWNDARTGVLGGYTPTGCWKRDFWGDKYFQPYPDPHLAQPAEAPSPPPPDRAADGPPPP
jgi:hypothetical protein